MVRRLAGVVSFLVGCSGSPERAPTVVASTESPSPTAIASAPVSAAPSAESHPPTPALAMATDLRAASVFDRPVLFLSTGEEGRIGVLANENGEVVPHRRERTTWQRLALPPAEAAKVGALAAGIFFGRDNRPRLMGYRDAPARIVYLRFKDDAWHPETRELGSLGGDGPGPLFGVLGEADPEVVCRGTDRCLQKSRKGWTEMNVGLPPTAVVRAFEGKGYAVTSDGLYRAEGAKLVRVGPAGAWHSRPTGFWVGPGEVAAVVEPSSGLLFSLEAHGTEWKSEKLAVHDPTDVAGPPSDRFVAGASGLIHGDGTKWLGIEGAKGPLDRVILASWGIVSGGAGGVFEMSRSTAR